MTESTGMEHFEPVVDSSPVNMCGGASGGAWSKFSNFGKYRGQTVTVLRMVTVTKKILFRNSVMSPTGTWSTTCSGKIVIKGTHYWNEDWFPHFLGGAFSRMSCFR